MRLHYSTVWTRVALKTEIIYISIVQEYGLEINSVIIF